KKRCDSRESGNPVFFFWMPDQVGHDTGGLCVLYDDKPDASSAFGGLSMTSAFIGVILRIKNNGQD
ncbi:MAG: hypothetical protein JW709_00135, partial [Sedimentisphaerales bacterium]|nr:hypothetical protein [Sedimentisphaerales bacterium]